MHGPGPQEGAPGQPWTPPLGGGRPGPSGPSASTVVIPAWVSSDWPTALRIAGVGQLLLLLGGVVVSVILLLAVMASQGLDFIQWGPTAVSPLVTMLGWAGAGEGSPLLITGALYTFFAYRYALRWSASEIPALLSSRPRASAFAGKIGVVSAGILLAVAILLNSFGEDLLVHTATFSAAASLDLTSLVFFSLFIGALAGLFALLVVARTTLDGG